MRRSGCGGIFAGAPPAIPATGTTLRGMAIALPRFLLARCRRSASTALLLVVAGCAALPEANPIGAAIAELVATPELAGGRVGVQVVDVGDGRLLGEHASDRGFATASNMKLLSSAVAMRTLGAGHRLRTELWALGELRAGVLAGDLALVGHGDPTFAAKGVDSAELVAMAEAVRAAGITRVLGGVLGDDTWQGTEHLGHGWQWDYLDEDYAAPFGALCCAGNVVTARIGPGAGADVPPDVQWVHGSAPAAQVDVRTVAAAEPTALVAHRSLGGDDVTVSGTIAVGSAPQTVTVTVRDPAVHAAATLAAALRAAGVTIEGGAGRYHFARGEAARLLHGHESPPLAEIVAPMLTRSDNLYAEQVWRVAAREAVGDGSTAAAERHAKAKLAELGVPTDGMVLADGSGLSRRNLVQPRQLAALLVAMARDPLGPTWRSGLPLAGESGTLRNRLREGPSRGHVHAKTGYISRVVCLSGYVDRREPKAPPLAFVVMLNDFTCDDGAAKAAVDRFVDRLATFAGW